MSHGQKNVKCPAAKRPAVRWWKSNVVDPLVVIIELHVWPATNSPQNRRRRRRRR